MTNCCDDYGQCTRGPNCPARETPHDIAARHFWEPGQKLHIEAYTGPSRLIRALDFFGNSADRFADWCGRVGFGQACAVTGLIAVCAFAGVVVLK